MQPPPLAMTPNDKSPLLYDCLGLSISESTSIHDAVLISIDFENINDLAIPIQSKTGSSQCQMGVAILDTRELQDSSCDIISTQQFCLRLTSVYCRCSRQIHLWGDYHSQATRSDYFTPVIDSVIEKHRPCFAWYNQRATCLQDSWFRLQDVCWFPGHLFALTTYNTTCARPLPRRFTEFPSDSFLQSSLCWKRCAFHHAMLVTSCD